LLLKVVSKNVKIIRHTYLAMILAHVLQLDLFTIILQNNAPSLFVLQITNGILIFWNARWLLKNVKHGKSITLLMKNAMIDVN